MSEPLSLAVVVCGGRDYTRFDRVSAVLFKALEGCGGRMLVIDGGQTGADDLAAMWVQFAQMDDRDVVGDTYRADWDEHGKAAGPIRNKRMLDRLLELECPRKGVIAFPGGAGTANMVSLAKGAGVKVMEVRDEQRAGDVGQKAD